MISAIHNTLIIVAGPTAVGKTSLAIEMAKHYETEIISADSRQCFRELNIGVARPSEDQLQTVKHHFIASHSIQENVNAGIFARYALEKVHALFQTHAIVIMPGGTGLYIKAFCEGMDEIPDLPAEIRRQITLQYEKTGLAWLQEQVRLKDPKFYQVGETQNPQRLIRALEVVEATGKSILEFRKGKKEKRDFNIIKIGLQLPKDELHRNIDSRVGQMIEAGLVEEVKKLSYARDLNALRTVGYSEIFDFMEGKLLLEQAIDQIKTNTRQYAKRQMTWFKRDRDITWVNPTRENTTEVADVALKRNALL